MRQRVRARKLLADGEILALFEEWRYAERPSIRIALFLKDVAWQASPEELKEQLTNVLVEAYSESEIAVRVIDASFDPDIIEIAIKYPRALSYIDVDEQPGEVTELAFGFAFLAAP